MSIVRRHIRAAATDAPTRRSLHAAATSAYGNEPVLVHMYGTWCPHCVSMEDDMTDTLERLRRGGIVSEPHASRLTVLQIESALLSDVQAGEPLMLSDLRRLGRPGGYPYIALVGRDAAVQEHQGDRSASGLEAFIRDALLKEMQRCSVPVSGAKASAPKVRVRAPASAEGKVEVKARVGAEAGKPGARPLRKAPIAASKIRTGKIPSPRQPRLSSQRR